MISLAENTAAQEWLRKFLLKGGLLSQFLAGRLNGRQQLFAIAPEFWAPNSPADLDLGGSGLARQHVLDPMRQVITDHLTGEAHCILIEDRYALPETPCESAGSLPWLIVSSGQEELYWMCDRRSRYGGPDAALGAASGRRFLAVLSMWGEAVPIACSRANPSLLHTIADKAVGLITEIFDGESYLLTRFDPIEDR